jgi:Pvc16 N-terminal domain
VLRDVDTSLAAWLTGYLPPGAAVVFDAPEHPATTEPALGLYLHDVREEAELTPAGWSTVRDAEGNVIGRSPPQLRYRLTYLLTAWAGDPLAEHEMLGAVLAGCAVHQTIPVESLRGRMAEAGQPVLVRCAPFERGCDPRELWAAWRIPPRTALELSVLAPLPVAAMASVPSAPRKIDLRSARRPPAGTAAAPGHQPRRPRIDEH